MQPTPTPTIPSKLFDPGSWTGALSVHVIGSLVGGLLLLAAIAVLGWLFRPFKWLWRNRTLPKLIFGRREFILVYQPQDNYSKTVIFLDDGQIGEGKNNNEDTWRIRRGCLEFLARSPDVDGKKRASVWEHHSPNVSSTMNPPSLKKLTGSSSRH